MRDSLRGRLLLWYTAILALVIVSFALVVGFFAWRSRVAEIDASLRLRIDAVMGGLRAGPSGTYDLDLPASARAASDPIDHVVWTPDGEVLDASIDPAPIARPTQAGARTRGNRREVLVRATDGAWVLAGRSLEPVRAEMLALLGTFSAVGGAALILSFVGGWWWVGRALEPIDRISRTARAMTDGDLTARIPIDRVETELGQVATALNSAFDRLHASLERQRRFAADASHELRTPVTTIATETEWALDRDRPTDEYRQSIAVCRRAAERMQAIVEDLLALARSDAGADAGRREACALDALVRDAVDDLRPLAAKAGVSLAASVTPVMVSADPPRLREAITNIVLNAIQYNHRGGRVDVALAASPGIATVTVTDTGIGIPDDELARVFDPFVRLDPSRSRQWGGAGAGLGLAVTRAVVVAHGGDVRASAGESAGARLIVTLPRSTGPVDIAPDMAD